VLYAYEVCGACETLEYDIDRVAVSDFVAPAWFESFRQANSTQFDFKEQIKGPFKLLSGGYIGTYKVESGSGRQQVTAEGTKNRARVRPAVGSRCERRRIQRSHWIRSSAV